MATAAARTTLIQLTVAMFDAAPGANNLSEFVNALDGGQTLGQIANSLATSATFKGIYPDLQTTNEFAVKFINNLVGAEATDAAKAWAVAQVEASLNAGTSKGQVMLDTVTALLATTSTDWTNAKAAVANQVDVATWYSVDQNASGADFAALQAVTSAVTSDAATVATAKATPAVSGGTFTLTTGADNISGTTGNDTINGANGTTDTLSVIDVIDGGAGTDTLSLVLDTGGVLPAATITNVEVLSLRDTVAATIDLDLIGSLTTVELKNGTANTTLQNVDTTITSIVMDTVKGDTVVSTGDVTALNVTLKDVNGAAANDNVDLDITEATTAITTLNLTATGNSTLEVLNADEATTVSVAATTGTLTVVDWNEAAAVTALTTSGASNITFSNLTDAAALLTVTHTGAGTLDLDNGTALATTVTAVDASGAAGAVKLTSGAITTDVKGGAGNDTVDINALVYSGTAKLDGGAGTGDVLSISDASATVLTTAAKANISNFEILDVTGSTGGDTVDYTALTGLTGMTFGANTGAVTVTNLAAAATLSVSGNQADLELGIANATSPGNTTDSVTLNVDTTSNTVTLTELGAEGTESLTIVATEDTSDDALTVTAFATGTDITTATVSGSADVVFTTTAAATALASLDASASTGDITVTAVAATKNIAITTGTGADDINGSALLTAGDVLSAGAGIDRLTGNGGADTYTGGAGADTFEVDVVSGAATVTVNTITDFEKGASGDQIEFSIGDLEALTVLTDLATGNGSSIAAQASPTINEVVVGTGETLAAADDILVFTAGTFADAAAFKTAIVSAGSTAMTWGAAPTAADGILAVYSDGTDSHVALITNSGTTAGFASGEIAINNLVTLSGVSTIAAGDFVSANFEILA